MMVIENFRQVNEVTLDFLKLIPEQLFHQKAFKGRFQSFAWEFACIITTREMYINGLKNGTLNEKTVCRSDTELEKLSQAKIREDILKTCQELLNLIKDEKIKKINFWGKIIEKPALISWLLQHEQLHFGKLMLYLSNVGIKLPQFLKEMWGPDSFSKKN